MLKKEEFRTQIGVNLKAIRARNKHTQQQAADLMCTPLSTYRAIEGGHSDITSYQVYSYSRHKEVSIHDVLARLKYGPQDNNQKNSLDEVARLLGPDDVGMIEEIIKVVSRRARSASQDD